jgi:neutral amino acid transport system permease protein
MAAVEAGSLAAGSAGSNRINALRQAIRRAPRVAKVALAVIAADIVLLLADAGFPGTLFDLPLLQALALVALAAVTIGVLTLTAGRPAVTAGLTLVHVAGVLIILKTLHAVAQTGVAGITSGSYLALGAIGLTLVYGILKLVNFAHGDLLTFGAYIGLWFNLTLDTPFWVAVIAAIFATALLGTITELTMWRPMRKRKAGLLQLLLMTIGLAFVIRYTIQIFAGTRPQSFNPADVSATDSVEFVGLSIGRVELIVVIVAFVALISVGLMLRLTSIGRQMRALADNFELAETTGINTGRVVLWTWVLAGGLAGLAGVIVTASIGQVDPNTGFQLLLPLFAAVVLGGIGNAFGALAGGLVIGLSQEWSTLLVPSPWKVAVSFLVLIGVLIFRPQGIFGKERTL